MAKGQNGSVWVFHRGSRIWGENSFEGENASEVTHKEPISEAAVLQLDQDSGSVLVLIVGCR